MDPSHGQRPEQEPPPDDQATSPHRLQPEAQGVYLEAHASGAASVHQAGRDQHFHYGEGPAARRRTTPGRLVDECPYPGLAAFDKEQARWFFGRDELVAELLTRLDQRVVTGGIQLVVAPSGAGKSSLLQAGLIPRLKAGALPGSRRWPVLTFTPTATPLTALTTQIGRITGAEPRLVAAELAADPGRAVPMLRAALLGRGDQRTVVVVDQFEELFTLCGDEEQRRLFIEVLAQLAGGAQPVALALIGIRADFYTACVNYPSLRPALQDRPLVVGAMSRSELREAIVYPAQDVGMEIEPGLVEVLLRDLGATAGAGDGDGEGVGPSSGAYVAGRLPLLAHALRVTWFQRHGATLTLEGYQTTGGIQRAIATTAEHAYTGLDAAGQAVARSLFLRLVKIGDGTQDTRRRISRAELVEGSADPATAAALVDHFTQARLLTQHDGSVEITHEALLTSWPQLHRWIDGDRSGRLVRQDLEEAASGWDRDGRDSSLLYRGNRLESVHSWAQADGARTDLSPVARAFLSASTRQQRRAHRLRTGVIAALTVLTVAATSTAVLAFQQERETAAQRDLVVYNRFLAEADQLRDKDVSLSAQFAVLAHRKKPAGETAVEETSTRLIAAASSPLAMPLSGHTDLVSELAFSPDGRTLASASHDNTIRLWNLSDRSRPTPLGRPLQGHRFFVAAVAFSPDGQLLASGGGNGVRLWNMSDPAKPTPAGKFSDEVTVDGLAFSPDGRVLATNSGSIRLWDVTDPLRPTPLGTSIDHSDDGSVAVDTIAFSADGQVLASRGGDNTIRFFNVSDPAHAERFTNHLSHVTSSFAFAPRGRLLAGLDDNGAIQLWNLSDLVHPKLLNDSSAHPGTYESVTFGAEGNMLVTSDADGNLQLWNITRPSEPVPLGQPLAGHTRYSFTVAFSPDGSTVARGSGDGAIRLWNLTESRLLVPAGAISSATMSRDGSLLASGSQGKTVQLWDVSDPAHPRALGKPLTGHTDAVTAVAISPDGRTLAGGGNTDDRTIRLWDITDSAKPRATSRLTGHKDRISALAFTPDGRTLASVSWDGAIHLWNVTDPAHPILLAKSFSQHTRPVEDVAFSPDGRTLASADWDGAIHLWNVTDPAHPILLAKSFSQHTNTINDVAFSPDGHILASASDDETIQLWDVSNPAKPTALGKPLTGHTGAVTSVAFRPDGRTLASGGGEGDRAIRLWDITDPARARPIGEPLTGHSADVESLAYAPNGQTIASAGERPMLWNLDEKQAIRHICQYTGNSLSREEWRRHIGAEIPFTPACP